MILDDVAHAEMCLETGYIDKAPTDTMKCLTKYYRHKGLGKTRIKKKVVEFFEENMQGFILTHWDKTITRIVNRYSNDKYSPVCVKTVNITQKELNSITHLKNNKLEYLSFILLVYCKVWNQINPKNNNWVNMPLRDYFKAANVEERLIDQGYVIHELVKSNIATYSKQYGNLSLNINIVDENSPIAITITDFDNAILYYHRYKGVRILDCQCGKLFKPNSNRQKYCSDCARKNDLAKKRRYAKKAKSLDR